MNVLIDPPDDSPRWSLEACVVDVLAPDTDETFEVDAEAETLLLESIAQCRRGQTTPMASLLAGLRSRE